MSKQREIPEWIMIRGNQLICDRCGATRPLHLPAAFDDAIMQGRAFSLAHERCPAPPAEAQP
jgi:hypothetical protein